MGSMKIISLASPVFSDTAIISLPEFFAQNIARSLLTQVAGTPWACNAAMIADSIIGTSLKILSATSSHLRIALEPYSFVIQFRRAI